MLIYNRFNKTKREMIPTESPVLMDAVFKYAQLRNCGWIALWRSSHQL